MVARQQIEPAIYDGIVTAYKSGATLNFIEDKFGVARNTIYRAVRLAGLEGRGKGRTPAPTQPASFDRFSKVPMVKCQCGFDCGLEFKRVLGQRTRRWHKDCPHRPLRNHTPRPARKQAPHRGHGRAASSTEGRKRVEVCKVCCDLPHRRAYPVCTEAWITEGGKRRLAPGCGRPAEDSPSLKDHEMVTRCGAFLAPLASEE